MSLDHLRCNEKLEVDFPPGSQREYLISGEQLFDKRIIGKRIETITGKEW